MKWLTSLACFTSLIVGNASFAGIVTGNGGDIILCEGRSDGEILDFYVGRRHLNLVPRDGMRSDIVYDVSRPDFVELEEVLPVVESWLGALALHDPARAATYRGYLQTFPEEWRLLPNQDFEDIDDLGDILIEDGCHLEQLAVQVEPESRNDGRYLVSQRLWRLLPDKLQRAGLVLHEIVYRDALRRGHTDSYRVRRLTALIADTAALGRMTPEEYDREVTRLLFTAFIDVQAAGMLPPYRETYWVLYPEVVDSAAQANRLCVERLGNNASAGISTWGHRRLDRYSAIAARARQQLVAFWHINGRGQAERWGFDGWNTQKVAMAPQAQVLCSSTP